MTEFKLTIEAPALAQAINTLAAAIQSRPVTASPSAPKNDKAKVENAAPAPIPAAQTAAPAPVQMPTVAPAVQPPVAPMPTVTAPVAPALTLEAIANAGAGLLERGMMEQLMGLLDKYGVKAVTMLRPDQLPYFAVELRALGAAI